MPERLLEEKKRLSKSMLWKMQEDAYCQFGIDAWAKQGVPSYITSNSYTANSYAHVVLGYLRDLVLTESIDFKEPFYLFDLGAGTGRFAYLFLKELLRLIEGGNLAKIKLCYVMTDIADANLAYWQKHPLLEPYFTRRILDCALYHHEDDQPIFLVHQNKELKNENVVNPIVLIANYFFDTIPQDLFRVKEGNLEEGRTTLTTENPVSYPEDLSVINHLKAQFSYHPVSTSQYYYEDRELNVILESYRKQFDLSPFFFPTGAFKVLRKFKELSNSRALLVAGDQGVSTAEQVNCWGEPEIALHGTFSFAVSYHALGEFFEMLGGKMFHTTFPDPAFVVAAAVFCSSDKPDSFHETKSAFDEHLSRFEPMDYLKLVSIIEDEWQTPTLDSLLLLIKLGNWDAISLHSFFPMIRKLLPNATSAQKKRLLETIHRAWDLYYPITENESHFIVNLGILLFEIEFYEEACVYFERAVALSESNETALKNLEVCREQIQK